MVEEAAERFPNEGRDEAEEHVDAVEKPPEDAAPDLHAHAGDDLDDD
jgi:hypothetical protein